MRYLEAHPLFLFYRSFFKVRNFFGFKVEGYKVLRFAIRYDCYSFTFTACKVLKTLRPYNLITSKTYDLKIL